MAFAEILLSVFWAVGPNGYLVHQNLIASPAREVLPVEDLLPVSGSLWIVFHEVEDWTRAFYTPARTGPAAAGTSLNAPLSAQLARHLPAERLLPSLDVPRLFLYAPHYRVEGRIKPIDQMPLDVSEGYFHALLEAWLDQQVRDDGALSREMVVARAEVVMADVPEPHRLTAYLSALADFGAHALSIANELHRLVYRQRQSGRQPCRLVEIPGTLFGLWPRIFTDAAGYPGHYYQPAEDSEAAGVARGQWMTSQGVLKRRDKDLLVAAVLEAEYRGDVARDFAALCPPAVVGEQQR